MTEVEKPPLGYILDYMFVFRNKIKKVCVGTGHDLSG